jgi:hypothetical protein
MRSCTSVRRHGERRPLWTTGSRASGTPTEHGNRQPLRNPACGEYVLQSCPGNVRWSEQALQSPWPSLSVPPSQPRPSMCRRRGASVTPDDQRLWRSDARALLPRDVHREREGPSPWAAVRPQRRQAISHRHLEDPRLRLSRADPADAGLHTGPTPFHHRRAAAALRHRCWPQDRQGELGSQRHHAATRHPDHAMSPRGSRHSRFGRTAAVPPQEAAAAR